MKQPALSKRALCISWGTHNRHDGIFSPAAIIALSCLLAGPSPLWANEPSGIQPLLSTPLHELGSRLPPGIHVLFTAAAVEQFLTRLEGAPPDWKALYGHGREDPDYDERLFELNRERDANRETNDARFWPVAFLWSGDLSTYDPESGGFRIALGPTCLCTSWGLVRFKYDDLPSNLIAIPTATTRERLRERIGAGQSIEFHVVMVGMLIPEEPIVYDFLHDEAGVGLIMPVVRVQRLFYVLPSDGDDSSAHSSSEVPCP